MFSNTRLFSLLYFILLIYSSDAFLSWFFNGKPTDNEDILEENDRKIPIMKKDVPFEMTVSDERFLLEQHLTKDLSPLDTCHHIVISEIKSTCTSLTEEELGKLAVRLLNCQSGAEGRTIYDCDRKMTLGECTRDMDATTWNAYQITSNRARAICYSTRQQQFRKKTEYTVNRLIQSTEEQVHAMNHIKDGQLRINEATSATLDKMAVGQSDLMSRQESLKASQMNIHTHIASNLRDLTKEKALIAAGNKELAEMTESIHKKLDNATKKLEQYESSQNQNHEEVINDLATISEKANGVWNKLDESTERLLQYHNNVTENYIETLKHMQKVNETIRYMLDTIAALEDLIESKLNWITSHIGGTDDRLSLLSTVLTHTIYLILGAASVSFLQTPFFSRVALLLVVPLNVWSEVNNNYSLGFTAMTLFLLLIVILNWCVECIFNCHQRRKHQELDSISFNSTSNSGQTYKMLAPISSPEEQLFEEVSKKGLSTPDLRKIVMVIESLCKQGVLSPVSKTGPGSDVNVPCEVSNVPATTDPLKSHRQYKAGDADGTPQDVCTPPHNPILDLSQDRDISDSAKAKVELVRRRLLNSPVGDTSFGQHYDRATTPRRSHLLRASPSRTSPSTSFLAVGRSSARSSRSSTPRPTCHGFTLAGLPCRNSCTETSRFCFRHQPDEDEVSD